MLKKLISLLVCLLLTMNLFIGCGNKSGVQNKESTGTDINYDQIEFTPTMLTYSEPGGALSMLKDIEVATVNKTTYGFEPNIPDKEREECIEQTERLLEHLGFEGELSIYIYDESEFEGVYVTANTVYTHTQTWKSADYFTCILYGIYGEFCHFGMIYGYANYICEQLYKIKADMSSLKFETGFEFFDLNYLCFHPDFASEDDISIAKSISNAFVRDYIANKGVKAFEGLLISSALDSEYIKANDALCEYYRSKGIETEITDIRYKPCGIATQYAARSDYATFFIPYGWNDRYNTLYPDSYNGFLNDNYKEANTFFTVKATQMRQYQDFFALDGYDNSLEIYFLKRRANISYYFSATHTIELISINSLMHEYIHSITVSKMTRKNELAGQWAVEGFTRHYDLKYSKYACDMLSADYVPSNIGVWYANKVGRPLDLSKDIVNMDDVLVHLQYPTGNLDPDFSYATGASFVNYLINNYGEQKVLDYILDNHDFSTLTSKSFDEVVADWKAYIQSDAPLQ